MSIVMLFPAIEEKLPPTNKYNIFYKNMREDIPNDCGIYLYESSNDLEDISGTDIYDCIKVQVQVLVEGNFQAICEGLDWLTKFVERIESEPSTISGVEFISVMHQGPKALDVGQNDYGFELCRSVLDIKYTLNQ